MTLVYVKMDGSSEKTVGHFDLNDLDTVQSLKEVAEHDLGMIAEISDVHSALDDLLDQSEMSEQEIEKLLEIMQRSGMDLGDIKDAEARISDHDYRVRDAVDLFIKLQLHSDEETVEILHMLSKSTLPSIEIIRRLQAEAIA